MWGIRIPKRRTTASTYIIRDRRWPERFKLGFSHDPIRRASGVGGKVYHRWEFLDVPTALYVEQTMIGLLENYDYKRITSDGWFEIDENSIKVLIEIMKGFISQLKKWQYINAVPYCELVGSEGPAAEYVRANREIIEKYQPPPGAKFSMIWANLN